MNDAITLEDALRSRANKDSDAEDFYAKYIGMKNYLEDEYYRWIQAECPYFTDHGERHIASVIQSTSQLLQPHLKARSSELSSLDLFLILVSILWHDVGNVYGRSGHAARVAEMTKDLKKIGFPNPDVHRLVVEISKAHSGNEGLSTPRDREDCSTAKKTYTVFPSALAAVVRFADEISENRTRASEELLPSVPNENRIYWEYALCVAASVADPLRQRVRVTYSIPQSSAAKKFQCEDYPERFGNSEVSLIHYIICRVEKINTERVYCSPHFNRYVNMRELEVSLTLTHDTQRIATHEDTLILGDGGMKEGNYPTIDIFDKFFEDCPRWNPEQIEGATQ